VHCSPWVADPTPADYLIQGGQYIGFANPKPAWKPVAKYGPGKVRGHQEQGCASAWGLFLFESIKILVISYIYKTVQGRGA